MRPRNLFTDSETYVQQWSLAFLNPLTSLRFSTFLNRVFPSLHRFLTLFFLLLLIACLYSPAVAGDLVSAIVALALYAVVGGNRTLRRLLFALPNVLAMLAFSQETVYLSYAEELLVLFPGAVASNA